jgi:hypothetical protein
MEFYHQVTVMVDFFALSLGNPTSIIAFVIQHEFLSPNLVSQIKYKSRDCKDT